MPARLLVHDSVEVPEPPVMLAVLRVHVRLVELVVAASATVPVKPLTGLTVTVDVPATPDVVVTLAGLAVRVKSNTRVCRRMLTMSVLKVNATWMM